MRKKIAIIGFSRFGQLWAQMLKDFGDIFIFNRTDRRKEADSLSVSFFGLDELDKISEMDMVFLCTSISSTEEIIGRIKNLVKEDALVADVCSVKNLPCQWLKDGFGENINTIGTHPMFGPDSIKTGIKGKQIVLCPVNINQNKLSELKDFFNKIGLSIIETTPEDHDRQVAKSLSLVHFIGRGLEKMEIKKQEIATLGFERLLAVCETVSNDSWKLFFDMQKYNPYAKEVRSELLRALGDLEKEISKA